MVAARKSRSRLYRPSTRAVVSLGGCARAFLQGRNFRNLQRGSRSNGRRWREDRSSAATYAGNFSDPPLCRDRLCLESPPTSARITFPLDLLSAPLRRFSLSLSRLFLPAGVKKWRTRRFCLPKLDYREADSRKLSSSRWIETEV